MLGSGVEDGRCGGFGEVLKVGGSFELLERMLEDYCPAEVSNFVVLYCQIETTVRLGLLKMKCFL